MRYTLATGVLASLVFLGFFLFGPGDSNGPPQQLAAQSPEQPKAKPQPKAAQPVPPIPALPDVLRQPVDVEFRDTPLRDVAKFLGDRAKLSVFIDDRALKEENIAVDLPITITSVKTPLYLVLNRILKPKNLAWYHKKGLLFITTKIAAEDVLVTRYYPMNKLLDSGYSPLDIVDLVQNMTEGPWVDLDGTGGELMFVGRLLTVRQTYPAHREIAQLLAALEQHSQWMKQLQTAPEPERAKLWQAQTEEQLYLRLEPKSHAKLREALQKLVDVEFIDTPLKDVAAFLSDSTGVLIALDEAALQEEAISLDHPINLTLKAQTLETAFELILDPIDGAVVLSDGTILITTKTEAEDKSLYNVIYNVQDIADNQEAMLQLEQAVFVATEGPWMDRDGTGGIISPLPKFGTMIVRQNEKNHQAIVELLQHQRRQADSDIKLQTSPEQPYTAIYRMNAAAAEDLLESLPEIIAPETWKTDKSNGQGTIRKVAAGQAFLKPPKPPLNNPSKKLREKSTPKPEDEPDQPEYIVVPRAALVIRQTPNVHRKIQDFLRSLLPAENVYAEGIYFTHPNHWP